MEDLKINIDKLNKVTEDLPEVPRLEDGCIDLEAITIRIDEKNNRIVSDEILENYYRELPKGIINQSGTWRTNGTGGKLKIFGADIEEDREIQSKGGKVLQAALKQQRTFADVISIMLAQKASKNDIEDLELKPGADNLDVIIAAAAKQASRGNVKAMEFLRDTIGQKPTEKLSAEVTALTPEDKELLERVSKRLDAE